MRPANLALVAAAGGRARSFGRLPAVVAAATAAVLGAAPHVLHHAGPLAGAAVVAGATGKLLFGALGLAAAIPTLRGLRRRSGSWRLPAGALAAMVAIFTFSSLVVGPALTDREGDRPATPPAPDQTKPLPEDHDDSHHP